MRALRRHWARRQASHPAARAFLEAKLPRQSAEYRDVEFLAVDLEMTDLDPRKGEIVSIGSVPVIGAQIPLALCRSTLVRSTNGVGVSATIHGIHDREVVHGLPLEEALVEFLTELRGRVLLLHHAPIDLAYLNRGCKKVFGVPLLAPVVDTLAIEKHRLLMRQDHIGQEELRLFSCRERYNLPRYKAHDALVDAVGTAELFLAQVSHIGGKGPLTLKELLRWSAG